MVMNILILLGMFRLSFGTSLYFVSLARQSSTTAKRNRKGKSLFLEHILTSIRMLHTESTDRPLASPQTHASLLLNTHLLDVSAQQYFVNKHFVVLAFMHVFVCTVDHPQGCEARECSGVAAGHGEAV